MRKTNHAPWMGRTVIVAIMVLVGIGAFAGSAQAQVDLQNYMGWWDRWTGSTGCTAMINVVNTLEINYYDGRTPTGEGTHATAATTGATSTADKARWCVPWSGLSTSSSQNDAKNLKDGVTMTTAGTTATDPITRKTSDNIFNAAGYWTSIGAGTNAANTRRLVLGVAPGGTDPGDTYGTLSRTNADMVDAAYMSLMPGGMMPTTEEDEEEEAPALPLVGVGILGLLLAGRGAWLRRRNA